MAILKIRDANGNVQEILAIKGNDGNDGKDYVLTDADKQEIAGMVEGGGGGTVDLSNYALIRTVTDEEFYNLTWTDELAKTILLWAPETDEAMDTTPFLEAYIFSFTDGYNNIASQVAITSSGKVYHRSSSKWTCISTEYLDSFIENEWALYVRSFEEINESLTREMDDRVKKIAYNSTDDTLQGRVYVVDKTNTQTSKELRVTRENDSIPVRNDRGNFNVGTPLLGVECANKQYVDDAMADRVEKIEYTSDNGTYKGAVYIVDYSNTDTYKQLSSQAMADTIPLRNHNRNFYVGEVKLDYECTNKKYVDDAIAALKAELINGDEESY